MFEWCLSGDYLFKFGTEKWSDEFWRNLHNLTSNMTAQSNYYRQDLFSHNIFKINLNTKWIEQKLKNILADTKRISTIRVKCLVSDWNCVKHHAEYLKIFRAAMRCCFSPYQSHTNIVKKYTKIERELHKGENL